MYFKRDICVCGCISGEEAWAGESRRVRQRSFVDVFILFVDFKYSFLSQVSNIFWIFVVLIFILCILMNVKD